MPILLLAILGLMVVAKKSTQVQADTQTEPTEPKPKPVAASDFVYPKTPGLGGFGVGGGGGAVTAAQKQAAANAANEGHYRLRVDIENLGIGLTAGDLGLLAMDYETLRMLVIELEAGKKESAKNMVSKAMWPVTARCRIQGIVNPGATCNDAGAPPILPNTGDSKSKDADAYQRAVTDLAKKGCMEGAKIVETRLVSSGNPYAAAVGTVLAIGGDAVVCNNVAVYVWDGYKWVDSSIFSGNLTKTIRFVNGAKEKVQDTVQFLKDIRSGVYGKIPGVGPLLKKYAGFLDDVAGKVKDKVIDEGYDWLRDKLK